LTAQNGAGPRKDPSDLSSTSPSSTSPSSTTPSGPALVGPAEESSLQVNSGLQRAASALRLVLPFVEGILSRLDGNLEGNLGAIVLNLLAPKPDAPPAEPLPPPVDLAPLEDGLAGLNIEHRELRGQVVEQIASLGRMESRLEMVGEATRRNTLEQQELIEDLKGINSRVNRVAVAALGLLTASLVINAVLYLRMLKIIP
jgi:hypothetical protein